MFPHDSNRLKRMAKERPRAARSKSGYAESGSGLAPDDGLPSPVRSGWEEAARELAKEGEDYLLDEPRATLFDEQEWEW